MKHPSLCYFLQYLEHQYHQSFLEHQLDLMYLVVLVYQHHQHLSFLVDLMDQQDLGNRLNLEDQLLNLQDLEVPLDLDHPVQYHLEDQMNPESLYQLGRFRLGNLMNLEDLLALEYLHHLNHRLNLEVLVHQYHLGYLGNPRLRQNLVNLGYLEYQYHPVH